MSNYFNVLATLRLLYFAAIFNTGREIGNALVLPTRLKMVKCLLPAYGFDLNVMSVKYTKYFNDLPQTTSLLCNIDHR